MLALFVLVLECDGVPLQGWTDPDGYVHIMSRSDDIMNVAGHRLGSAAMEGKLAFGA